VLEIFARWIVRSLCNAVVFFVCYFLKPVDDSFLSVGGYGDVGHSCVVGGAVPVYDVGENFYDVSFLDALDWFALFLVIAGAFSDNEDLSAGVGVPVVSCAGFEDDVAHDTIEGAVVGY